jgi:hypothetical protein
MSLDIIRILVQYGQVDPMRLSSSKQRYTNLHTYCGPSAVFKWLVQQEYFQVDFDHLSEQGHTMLLHQICHRLHFGESFVRIQALLESGCNIQLRCSNFQIKGYSTLHCAISRLPFAIRNACAHNCESVIRALLVAGFDPHDRTPNEQTPLDVLAEWSVFKYGDDDDGKYSKTEGIDRWLQILSGLGFDLKRYGLKEEEIHYFRNTRQIHAFFGQQSEEFTLDFKYGDCSNPLSISLHSTASWVSTPQISPPPYVNPSWIELHTLETSGADLDLLREPWWITLVRLVAIFLISCVFSGLELLERLLVEPPGRAVLDQDTKNQECPDPKELRMPGSWVS